MKNFLVILSIVFLSLFFARTVNAATFNLLSSQATYKVGDTFDVNLQIDSENQGINGAQATIKFDNTLLDVVKADKTGSIFDFWLVDPSISANQVNFVAASIAGYNGKSLQVLRITFKVKGAGTENLVLSDATITAADGSGSNVLSQSNNLTVALTTSTGKTSPTQITRVPAIATGSPILPVISVPLYPDSTKWNNVSANFLVSWKLPKDVSGVAMVLDKFPSTIPSQSEGLFESKQFGALAEGVYYIHARYKNNIGWGPVEHYKIAIDTNPPSKFSIVFPNGEPTDDPAPAIVYKSSDSFSGVVRYEIDIDNNSGISVTDSSFTLPLQIPGKHTLKIIAYDNAGNSTESVANFEIISIEPPVITLVNKDVFTGEGGFFISGTANPKYKVRIMLKEKSGNVVYTNTIAPDAKGNWNVSIDTPLKKQTYQFEVATTDERGAVSNIVKSGFITVHDRPVLVIGSVEITPTWFFVLFLFIVIGAFGLGILFWQKRQGRVSRRVFIAEHDAQGILEHINKDLEKLSKELKDSSGKNNEINTNLLVSNLKESVKKMQKYVIGDIEDITKK